ncbi:MAG: hypothetical protein WKG00_12820 [Polyangiaceae bacterium]
MQTTHGRRYDAAEGRPTQVAIFCTSSRNRPESKGFSSLSFGTSSRNAADLEAKLELAGKLLALQKKAAEILGIDLATGDDS